MIWWPTEVPTLTYGLLTLRPLEEKDIPNIFKSCQDPVIPKFTRVPFDYTLAHAEFFVREKITFTEEYQKIMVTSNSVNRDKKLQQIKYNITYLQKSIKGIIV